MLKWHTVVGLIMIVSVGCLKMPEDSTSSKTPEPVNESPDPSGEGNPMERVAAEVGVGKKGRSLDNETGIGGAIAQPAKSLFAFKEKAVFEIQIPQALQLFEATEGRGPNSHDEFMSRIVKANNIKLPELPAGHVYVFDSDKGELMVERPAK